MLYTVPARTATRHITGRSRLNHLTDLHIGSLSTVICDYAHYPYPNHLS